jgi:hypothetical protein
MATVTAKGLKNGKAIEVTCWIDGDVVRCAIDGKDDQALEAELLFHVLDDLPIGGTYYPETMALRVVAALDGAFFDHAPDELHAVGVDEIIPYEEGVIY